MKKLIGEESKDLSLVFIKSQLICAQSLEIMLEHLIEPFAGTNNAGELCEILEDIANIYLNISERISAVRADGTIFMQNSSGNMSECHSEPKKITL